MTPRGRGAQRYPLEDLTPQQFEDLVFLLARIDHTDVVPVRNKDRGLDARLPDRQQRTLRGWQAKRYEKGKINWAECRKSVADAVAFWRPPLITFVFAHELSAKEQQAFRTELVERVDLPVWLDFMPEAEVQRRLRDTPEGRQVAAWLFEGSETEGEAIRRALAMGGELRDGSHAAERLGEIQRHLDRDPHLEYTTVTAKAGAPATQAADGTAISVIRQEGEQEVRLDAREKFPGALAQLGLAGAFVFTDDEAGKEAREALEKAQRTGRDVSIGSGIAIKMANVPVGLRGLMPDEPVFGEVSLISTGTQSRPNDLSIVGALVAGSHELGMSFAPLEPPVTDWDVTLAGATGGLEIFHSMRQDPAGAFEHKLDWRHTFGEGSAVEQLLACRVLRSALEGKPVRLLTPNDREQIWLLEPLEGDYADDIGDLESREQLLEAATELELWTGGPLEVPARASDEEIRELFEVVGRIRSPEIVGEWEKVDVVAESDVPDELLQIRVLEAREATIFADNLFIGIEVIDLPLAEGMPQGDEVRLRPVRGHEKMTARLYPPSVYPAEVARPPGRQTGGRVLVRPARSADQVPD
ncbi:MAG: hypothetical protein ACRDLL_01725 [Solirubrobacterales bacterium]